MILKEINNLRIEFKNDKFYVTDGKEIKEEFDNYSGAMIFASNHKGNKTEHKTKITDYAVSWLKIKDACMQTIGKQAKNEPNDEWKKKLLICQHSPLRRGNISWKWEDIPTFSSTHYCRHHVGCTPFVASQRSDRGGGDRNKRSQVEPVSMQMDANIQSLIDIASRRLCLQSDKTTIAYMNDLVETIREYDETLAWALVPQCVWANGCKEPFSNCKYYDSFAKELTREEMTNIIKRLDKYNEWRKR